MDNNRSHRVALGLGRLSHEGQHRQRIFWHSHVGPLCIVVLRDYTPTGPSFLGALEKIREPITGIHTNHMGLLSSLGFIAGGQQSVMQQMCTLLFVMVDLRC